MELITKEKKLSEEAKILGRESILKSRLIIKKLIKYLVIKH